MMRECAKAMLRKAMYDKLMNLDKPLHVLIREIRKDILPVLFSSEQEFVNFCEMVKKDRKKTAELMQRGGIRSVTFNNPYTTVVWNDGEVTMVKCGADDTYSKETGFLYCVAKRHFGDSSQLKKTMNYWIGASNKKDAKAIKKTLVPAENTVPEDTKKTPAKKPVKKTSKVK